MIPGFPHDLASDQQPGVSAREPQSLSGGCWLLAQVRVVEDNEYGLDRLNAAVRGRWAMVRQRLKAGKAVAGEVSEEPVWKTREAGLEVGWVFIGLTG